MSQLEIREATKEDQKPWHDLWLKNGARLPHFWHWTEFAAEDVGEPVRVVVEAPDKTLVAGFSFIRRKRRGLTILSHPSPAPWCGVLLARDQVSNESFLKDLFSAFSKFSKTLGYYIEVIFQPELSDLRPLIWEGWQVVPRYNYIHHLKEPGELERTAENSARRQIRKARSNNPKILKESDQLENLLSLWGKTKKRQSIPNWVSDGCFKRIMGLQKMESTRSCLGSYALTIGSEESSEISAGGVFARDSERLYYLLGAASLEEESLKGAPSLLHAEITDQILEEVGPITYDWVGANTPSVAQFKKKFRPELEITYKASFKGGISRYLLP